MTLTDIANVAYWTTLLLVFLYCSAFRLQMTCHKQNTRKFLTANVAVLRYKIF